VQATRVSHSLLSGKTARKTRSATSPRRRKSVKGRQTKTAVVQISTRRDEAKDEQRRPRDIVQMERANDIGQLSATKPTGRKVALDGISNQINKSEKRRMRQKDYEYSAARGQLCSMSCPLRPVARWVVTSPRRRAQLPPHQHRRAENNRSRLRRKGINQAAEYRPQRPPLLLNQRPAQHSITGVPRQSAGLTPATTVTSAIDLHRRRPRSTSCSIDILGRPPRRRRPSRRSICSWGSGNSRLSLDSLGLQHHRLAHDRIGRLAGERVRGV